jgi:hypothetical protein
MLWHKMKQCWGVTPFALTITWTESSAWEDWADAATEIKRSELSKRAKGAYFEGSRNIENAD